MAEVHGALRAEYISTKALIVSVSVKSLLRNYVIGLAPLTKDRAGELINQLKALLSDLPSKVVDSCCGTIGRMSEPNAHNALMALADHGVVDKEHASRWRRFRGMLAHGQLDGSERALEAFLLSLNLFHRIAASIAGFHGTVVHSAPAGEIRVSCKSVPTSLRNL